MKFHEVTRVKLVRPVKVDVREPSLGLQASCCYGASVMGWVERKQAAGRREYGTKPLILTSHM